MKRVYIVPFSWLIGTVCAAPIHWAFGWPFGIFNVLTIGAGACVGYVLAELYKGGAA